MRIPLLDWSTSMVKKLLSLVKSSFMALYQLNRSEEGSNERSKEDNTTYCFEVFLRDLEGGDVTGLSL